MNKRDIHLDMLKGILIILVVAGHFAADTAHDIIFLFHMPLFFIISGYLLKREKITDKRYTINKIATLFIPYAVYLMADFLFVRRTYSIKSLLGALWGGRYLSGTYWYMTCFVFALILFSFLLKRNWSDKKTVVLILVGGA